MPVNQKYIQDFIEGNYMHIVCKSVGNTPLFITDENRRYFLGKLATYSKGYFTTFSYILLKNHVHWLVKCNAAILLKEYLVSIPKSDIKSHQKKYLANEISYEQALEYQCKDFFIAYSMAYNKMYKRLGALFINPFRRIQVKDENHLINLIVYIHANILKHNIGRDFEHYKWSSYPSILSDKVTLLPREALFDLFGNRESFIQIHRELSQYYYDHDLSME